MESEQLRYEELYYPNRLWTKPRQRTYAEMKLYREQRMVTLEDEFGQTACFDSDAGGYTEAVTYATARRLSVITRFNEGENVFPWLFDALDDPRAKILATNALGIIGVSVHRGRSHASFINGNSWHRDLLVADDAPSFLSTLRRVADRLGVGSYDTPAAAGTATLYRAWQDLGLPLVRRCPSGLEDTLRAFKIGGRVESAGVGRAYPVLHEVDMRRAHSSVAAGGLPWGSPRFEEREPTPLRAFAQPVYGVWRFAIEDEPLACSPVAYKQWGIPDAPVTWNLHPREYIYAGWLQEIAALRSLGVRVEWLYGWSWDAVSQELTPWLQQMDTERASFEEAGDPDAATLVKLMTNGAIGRWGSDGALLSLVTPDESAEGDKIIQLPHWAFVDSPNEAPLMALHQEPGIGKCVPLHWSSWIHMQVRMEVYRVARMAREQGAEIAAINCDGLLTDRPIIVTESVYAWKYITHTSARIPYARALTSRVAGVPVVRLPGIKRSNRAVPTQYQELPVATSPP